VVSLCRAWRRLRPAILIDYWPKTARNKVQANSKKFFGLCIVQNARAFFFWRLGRYLRQIGDPGFQIRHSD
jgi:hypothetical protein